MFAAGTRVRLVTDPGRVGEATGATRPRGGRTSVQVRFPDGYQYVPEDQLEAVAEVPADPVELLGAGRLGRAADLRRALAHVRLSGRLVDLLYSMEATNTDFYAYQFKPVLKLLAAPNQALLIADEVGLGKTIEAGLIWTELRSRADAQRLLVLCPAMLREKWRRELDLRFGVQADLVDAQEAHRLLKRSARDGVHAPFAAVASLQGLRKAAGSTATETLAAFLEERAEDEPLIDLLVVDEAHYLKNPQSSTARLGRQLRRLAHYVVLLSATPIHLGSEDLFHLLRLLDEATFRDPGVFDEVLAANAPLVRARDAVLRGELDADGLRDALVAAQQHPLLARNRQLEALLDGLPDTGPITDSRSRSELAHALGEVNLLSHTVTRTRKRDVTEWRVLRRAVPESVRMSQHERQLYDAVTGIVREFCARRDAHEGFLLVTPQRQMASSMPAALESWRRRAAARFGDRHADQGLRDETRDEIYDDLGVDPDDAEPGALVDTLLSRVNDLADPAELRASDTKYARLLSILRDFLSDQPAEKVVLFSYFRGTLAYLQSRLLEDGIPTVLVMGGTPDKDGVLTRFAEPGGPRILLASEVASEGVDLQFCRFLVNYDLPWNPMKVEQRIGRLDRLGQPAPAITIWNLFYADTIDDRIYARLYERLHVFEYALGAIEPVLGDQITALTRDLLSAPLTPEQEEARIDQTALALSTLRSQEEQLEQEAAHLVALGDYVLRQIHTVRQLNRWINGADVRAYVLDHLHLHYPGSTVRAVPDADETYDIALSPAAKHDLDAYIRTERPRSTTRLTQSAAGLVRCRFTHRVAGDVAPRAELVNHLHPLVRFVCHRVGRDEQAFHRATAVRVDAARVRQASPDLSGLLTTGHYAFSVQRWSVTGIVDQERLDYAAVALDTGRVLGAEEAEALVGVAAAHGQDWLAASNVVDLAVATDFVLNRCLPASDERYDRFVAEIKARNMDRADLQEHTLEERYRTQHALLLHVLEGHREAGSSLVAATEGRIRRLEETTERQRHKVRVGRETTSRADDIGVGLIFIS